MGLLDDAIREHLELKRRHGANPDDVARQEQEALGPSRRGEFAQPGQPQPEAAAEAVEAAQAAEAGEPAEEEAAAPPYQVEPGEAMTRPLPAAEEPPAIDEEPPAATEEPPAAPEEPADEEAEPPTERAAPGYDEDPWLEDEPDESPRPDEPSGEDVLEETPEFLQETPEHDRLWFEQKPPRHFDWDK
jgi:hypothetical protein